MPLKTDINEYPLVLKLILAQLVVQYGSTDSFRQVAEDLDKHPLLQNLGGIRKMSATRCRSLYLQLLENEGLELSPENANTEINVNKKRRTVTPELKLAQMLYMTYTEKVIQEIQDDETAFKETYSELMDLQKKFEETEAKDPIKDTK